MAKRDSPIGIFDSGIGGLTVANAITEHMPNESIIYFGDTAHLPYGEKSADAIRYYCLKISKFLISRGCKMIVIACNSAASAAYEVLKEFFDDQILLVNVVDPLVNAVANKDLKNIGVIATKVTIASHIYEQKLRLADPSLSIHSLATPLLVPMIEEGFFKNNISKAIIEEYLSSKGFENLDALLLACTHYPLIKKDIDAYFNGKVKVMDSNQVVAHEVEAQLRKNNLLAIKRNKSHQFFISDYTTSFEATAKMFYKEEIELKPLGIWQ